jgi:hypothetical protein
MANLHVKADEWNTKFHSKEELKQGLIPALKMGRKIVFSGGKRKHILAGNLLWFSILHTLSPNKVYRIAIECAEYSDIIHKLGIKKAVTFSVGSETSLERNPGLSALRSRLGNGHK